MYTEQKTHDTKPHLIPKRPVGRPRKTPAETFNRELSEAEELFIRTLLAGLPPVVTRTKLADFFGGLLTGEQLAKADRVKRGPRGTHKVGRDVVYNTEYLVRWMVEKYGVTALANYSASN